MNNEFIFRYFICRMLWDRYIKIISNMGLEKVWEIFVIRWRLKIYETIIFCRKIREMRKRKLRFRFWGRRWWR